MKIYPSAFWLACAVALWCGCASVAPPQTAAAGAKPPPAAATNDIAAAQPAEEEDPVEALPYGKGNPEALAHFAAGEGLESSGRHDQAMEEFYISVMADPGNEKTARDVAEWLLDQRHPERAVTLLSKVAQRLGQN